MTPPSKTQKEKGKGSDPKPVPSSSSSSSPSPSSSTATSSTSTVKAEKEKEKSKKRCPVYRWGERHSHIYITLELPGVDPAAASLRFGPGGCEMTFTHKDHELHLALYGRVLVGDSKVEYTEREVKITLRKAEQDAGKWQRLQKPGAPRVKACEKIDWDFWEDSDASDDDHDDANGLGDIPGLAGLAGKNDPFATMMKEAKRAKKDADKFAEASQPMIVKVWNKLPTRHLRLHDFATVFVLLAHLFFAPYNKVEESFGTQAAHDILHHGTDLARYDHHTFSGVVPRTFAGPLVLSLLTLPSKFLLTQSLGVTGTTKWIVLYIMRSCLAIIGASAIGKMRRAIDLRFGTTVGWGFTFLTATQFHLIYYGSRLLPNIFALWIVVFAMGFWLEERCDFALTLLAAAAAVFRCELVALLLPVALAMLLRREVTLWMIIKHVAIGAISSVAVTAPVDSLLWGRPLWPEFEVFLFNVVENRSSEYGTSPPLWYFTSALPRALLVSLPLVPFGCLIEKRRVGVPVASVIAFVAMYSFLPHKELRFILYVVPMLNLAAAVALARVVKWSDKNEGWLWLCFAYVGVGAMISAMFLTVSALNYPGGSALRQLHKLEEMSPSTSQPFVYIDNAAAQTGVSLWLEREHPWRYSRDESVKPRDYKKLGFTHIISEKKSVEGYSNFYKVDLFKRVKWGIPPIPHFTPYIYVHRRKDLVPISRAEFEKREKEHTPPNANLDHTEEAYDREL